MNKENMLVLTNIIGAVESGGQVYGKRNYAAYAGPYTNTPKEVTITLGWAQNYGDEARKLVNMIYDADKAAFEKIDKNGLIVPMLSTDWVAKKWNPSNAQKKVLIALLDSAQGHTAQDELFAELMEKFIKDCAATYTKSVKGQMMYCEVRHLGGKTAVDRIFRRCDGDYSTPAVLASLLKDQGDTSSNNQVGDKKFWSRHVACAKFVEQYAKEEDTPKIEYDPQKVLDVAESQLGYLEKKSNAYLDDKTKNAGSNNYTKYGRDMYKWTKDEAGDTYGVNYQWCDMFVDWCMVTAYGLKAAKALLGGWSAYTPTSAQYYKDRGQWSKTPQVGAQIFFHNSERICHTGIVYKVTAKKVFTIEGNTSDGSQVIANGGAVCKKSYSRDNERISGYGMPNYGGGVPVYDVATAQKWLNVYYGDLLKKHGGLLTVDGEYGPKTRLAALTVWKDLQNRKYGGSFIVGNAVFGKKCKKAAVNAVVKKDSTGTFTLICQLILAARECYAGPMDANGTTQTCEAIQRYQKAHGIATKTDANKCECDPDTWYSLFN